MPPFALPLGYSRIQRVMSFHELVTTPFGQGVNALCWERCLPGDFAAVVAQLDVGAGITPLSAELLQALPLSPAGRVATDQLLADLQLLREHGLTPELNCIDGYPRDEAAEVIPTDVFSFHADRAPVAADTYLCTYHGLPSEGLRNDHAQRRVDHPATRAALLQNYGGADDAVFCEHLSDCCYDLHYAPLPQAQPFSFGLGNLWRIAVDWPGSPVPPCLHRAPETPPGQPPRLLLIS